MSDKHLVIGLYAIKDEKMGVFFPPFASPSHIEAQRKAGIMTLQEDGQLNHYPADYSLYHVGDYDTNRGIIIEQDSPIFVDTMSALHAGIRKAKNA